ncbi:MAG: hypothetical protein V2A79_19865 [Planctomycetota bacterium]
MPPRVFDLDGTEKDWPWLQANYPGVTYIEARELPCWQLEAVAIKTGDLNAYAVAVDDPQGGKAGYVRVAWFWDTGDKPIGEAKSRYFNKVGEIKMTSPATGSTDFGFGKDSWINPNIGADGRPVGGPHWMWILSTTAYSDALVRTGWKQFTNHTGPLVATFRLVKQPAAPTDPPDPPPPPTGDTELRTILRTILRGILQAALDWLNQPTSSDSSDSSDPSQAPEPKELNP